MSATEDRARAAMRAIAATVDDAPPLELGQPDRATRGRRRAGGPPGGPGHRWQPWAAPLTAAAVVIAVALSLVLVKDLPGGGRVPAGRATATSGPAGSVPAGVPRYYVTLKELPRKNSAALDGGQFALVVADAATGKTLATVTPPANTTFQSVSAAADDRTFAVLAVSSATWFRTNRGTLTASWYKLVVRPGSVGPDRVRLSRLPVKPWSWTAVSGDLNQASSPGQIYSAALSDSGQELAVGDIPAVPAGSKPQNWSEVKVFSVATGQLLHDWTADDPNAKLIAPGMLELAAVPAGTPGLTWIDQDRALAVITTSASGKAGAVRRLNVSGPAGGSLLADSTVLWSGQPSTIYQGLGSTLSAWPPQVTADGESIIGVSYTSPGAKPGRANFGTLPLAAGSAARHRLRLVYTTTLPPFKNGSGGFSLVVLWASPPGDTMIVSVVINGANGSPQSARFMVVSHGQATPLAIPLSMVLPMWESGLAF